MLFHDRYHAGRMLVPLLMSYSNRQDVIVLALPRGGVPVAYEVAKALKVVLDIFLVRKLGVPGQSELAMGALASGGICLLNPAIIHQLHIAQAEIEVVTYQEQRELERREQTFRQQRPPLQLAGKTVILIEDGLATGASMLVAIRALKEQPLARLVAAVPVASPEACQMVSQEVDQFICVHTPPAFRTVGQWYDDFTQTEDQEVRDLLRQTIGV